VAAASAACGTRRGAFRDGAPIALASGPMKKTAKRVVLIAVLLVGSSALAMMLFRESVEQVLFADAFDDY
jgi:hypothetical protein